MPYRIKKGRVNTEKRQQAADATAAIIIIKIADCCTNEEMGGIF